MAFDYTTLFNRIKLVLDTTDALDTYQNTTLTADANAVLAGWSAVIQDLTTYRDLTSFSDACRNLTSSTSIQSAGATLIRNEIVRQIKAHDANYINADPLSYLYDQMETDAESIAANACTVAPTNPSTSVHQIAVNAKFRSGKTSERIYNETIDVSWNGTSFVLTGERSASNISSSWPLGSGLVQTLPLVSTNILTNGDFDTLDDVVDTEPASWAVKVGTASQIVMTLVAVHTVTISGTPTTGFYRLTLTHPNGNIQTTAPISFDDAGGGVQTAIQALDDFGSTTVATTGTGPNYTHTITFTGIAGTVPAITSTNEFDTGSIGHADISTGDQGGYAIYSMYWVGNASTLHRIQQSVDLEAFTVYSGIIWLKKTASTTGTLVISLKNGAGTIIADDNGVNNSVSIDVSTLSSSAYTPTTFFFRTPTDMPTLVFLDVAATVAINSAKNIYFDNLTLAPARAVSGFYAAAFPGVAPTSSQVYSIAATNNYAGRLQTAFMRFFGVQLPSSGTPTIADV